MNRIEKLQQHREAAEKQKNLRREVTQERLNDFVIQIKNLEPRIAALIEVANACINNGIEIDRYGKSGSRSNDSYENGTFITNGITHKLGFERPRRNEPITYLSIDAGGWNGPWDFFTDGTAVFFKHEENKSIRHVSVDEKEDISVLKKMLESFDTFESAFYKYVDSIISNGVEEKPCCVIKIHYSWGDEKPEILCENLDVAWDRAKRMALAEAETASIEHECEIGLSFNKDEHRITLRYVHDGTCCHYDIVNVGGDSND